MKKKQLTSIALIGLILSLSSCIGNSNSSASQHENESSASNSSVDEVISSESSSSNSSSSVEETTKTCLISFGNLLKNDVSNSPTSSSYVFEGADISGIEFTSCYGLDRETNDSDSYALKVGSGKKTGSLTINFSRACIVKQANIYASKYEGDAAVEYKCSSSANSTGMNITIDSEEQTKYSYLYLDAEKGVASNSVTFEATAKGRIYVYKIELIISSNGGSSSSSNSQSSQSSQSSSSSISSSSEYSTTSSSSLESDVEKEGYYKGVNWNTTGATLKTSLCTIISNGAKAIGYDALWEAYKSTDLKEDGTIWDMYSNESFDPNKDRAGNYKKEGDVFNREHTIPQSSFKSANASSYMVCDLFNVVPTDGYVNNRRSNYPHGNVSNATYTSKNGSKLGTGENNGYTGTVFEVIDEYKGDFARTYFYFVTRYEKSMTSLNYDAFQKNTYPSMSSWALKTYLAWNEMDPVSDKEINRNEAVYKIQKNRNPFIDHPEAIEKIWGSYN